MLKTIILLTGPREQAVLTARLAELNPDLAIVPLMTADDLSAVAPAALADARLIGFATPVIVSRKVLEALGHGAYNFHPGPPAYPGLCPAQMAVYDGATRFGATAHRMVERVDAGPIVAFERFDMPPGSSVSAFEGQAYAALARLFWSLAPALATQSDALDELDELWGPVKLTPHARGDLRYPARHRSAGAGSPHFRVRRQSVWRRADCHAARPQIQARVGSGEVDHREGHHHGDDVFD